MRKDAQEIAAELVRAFPQLAHSSGAPGQGNMAAIISWKMNELDKSRKQRRLARIKASNEARARRSRETMLEDESRGS